MQKRSTISCALVVFVVCLLSLESRAGLLFNSMQLATKNLDQMNQLVQGKIKESRKAKSGELVPLKEALQAVYARPNSDFMIDKVIGPVKNELDEHEAFEGALKSLTEEALGALKNTKAFQPRVQVTYLVFLENLIGDLKPRRNLDFEKSLLKQIQDADIKISKEASQQRRLSMMAESESPSSLAKRVLELPVESPRPEGESAPPPANK